MMTESISGNQTGKASQGSLLAINDTSHFYREFCRGLGFEPPDKEINNASNSLVGLLEELWGGNVEIIPMETIQTTMSDQIRKFEGEESGVLHIALDPAFNPYGVRVLDINRLSSPNGMFRGYGPRQGAIPIKAQLEEIREEAWELGITENVLIDDVSVTAGTILLVKELLNRIGLRTKGVVLGIATGQAVRNLSNEGIEVVTSLTTEAGHVVNTRDLIPINTRGGAVVDESSVPCNQQGIILRPPYPTSPQTIYLRRTHEWTGLPLSEVVEFSRQLWEIGAGFHSALSTCRDIQLRELNEVQSGYPGVPSPDSESSHFNVAIPIAEVISDGLRFMKGIPVRHIVYSYPGKR